MNEPIVFALAVVEFTLTVISGFCAVSSFLVRVRIAVSLPFCRSLFSKAESG